MIFVGCSTISACRSIPPAWSSTRPTARSGRPAPSRCANRSTAKAWIIGDTRTMARSAEGMAAAPPCNIGTIGSATPVRSQRKRARRKTVSPFPLEPDLPLSYRVRPSPSAEVAAVVEAAPGTPLSPGSPSRPDTSASPEVAAEAVAVEAVEVAEARSYRSSSPSGCCCGTSRSRERTRRSHRRTCGPGCPR